MRSRDDNEVKLIMMARVNPNKAMKMIEPLNNTRMILEHVEEISQLYSGWEATYIRRIVPMTDTVIDFIECIRVVHGPDDPLIKRHRRRIEPEEIKLGRIVDQVKVIVDLPKIIIQNKWIMEEEIVDVHDPNSLDRIHWWFKRNPFRSNNESIEAIGQEDQTSK